MKAETGMTFTDGAIHHNCPAWVAHHERRVLWEDAKNQDPDLFLSIGTGLSSQPVSQGADVAAERRKAQKHTTTGLTYMFRTAKGIIDNQLDCEATWRDYVTKTSGYTEPGRRNVRINVQLKGTRPDLDQVNQVQALEDQAFYSASRNPDIREVAHRLVASSFYFEKQGGFHHEHGTYSCNGKHGTPPVFLSYF